MTNSKKKPLVIELDAAKPKRSKAKVEPVVIETPAEAPEIVDFDPQTAGMAMQMATRTAARKTSFIVKWFWRLVIALIGFALSIAMWDFAVDMMARNLWLGRAAIGLIAALGLVCLFLVLRELSAISRLRRMDTLRAAGERLLTSTDAKQIETYCGQIYRHLKTRKDIGWALAKYDEGTAQVFDAPDRLKFTETSLMEPLDVQAIKEIESAARQVATATALVPLAMADVVIALTANIRMIRRIAEVYGGRAGTFGSWRLMKTVATHLVATGAVAIGDDMLGSLAGGGVLSKLSRRFGEGLINGALTARVGVAAMDVCRPMPFHATPRPKVTSLVKNALTGLFGSS